MEINIRSFKKGKHMERKLKKLYIFAFPADERAPFRLMMKRVRKGMAEMLAAFDGGEFVGFAYMVCNEKVAYLFYLAIEEEKRGMGYGSLIIKGVKQRYSGRRIFLAREQLDSSAENYQQRLSRHKFYLNRGFKDQPLVIREASVIYDVMSAGGAIEPEEYRDLIKKWTGKMLFRFVDMEMLRKSS